MKIAESYNASTAINMSMLSKYVKKKRNVIYVQHQIMIIEHVAFEKCQQDTNMSTAIRITQHES